VLLGALSLHAFNRAIEPELANRAGLVGSIVRASIQRALDLGMSLNQLVGTDVYLEHILDDFPEISFIAIVGADGTIAFAAGKLGDADRATLAANAGLATEATDRATIRTYPVRAGGALAANIAVGVDRAFIARQFQDVFLDVGVVVLVAILLAFEIMLALVGITVTAPLDRLDELLDEQARGDFSRRHSGRGRSAAGRFAASLLQRAEDLNARYERLTTRLASGARNAAAAARLRTLAQRFGFGEQRAHTLQRKNVNDIRLPLFLFATAEELSKPFLPLYIRAAENSFPWLGEQIVITLPLITYLAALVLLSPFSGQLASRFGFRRVFLTAVLPVAASHIGMSLAANVAEIAVWRGVAGAGYALATIACQEYVLGFVAAQHRARALGVFVTVIIGGTFCGTAVGGVLADRLGRSNVFLVGACLTLLAGALALRLLAPDAGTAGAARRPVPLPQYFAPLRNARFLALLSGVAIPANVLMAAFLWYLVPLVLADFGARTSDIGRAVMLYYLLILLLGPAVAHLVDVAARPASMAGAGAVLSGLGLLVPSVWSGPWPVVAAICAAGVAHAAIKTPQVVVALGIAERDLPHLGPAPVLGSLRLFERVGSIAGLLLTALLATRFGYAQTIGLTGLFVLIGAVAFVIVELISKNDTVERSGARQ
jgi:predicted MFS family arabinose efflux permease